MPLHAGEPTPQADAAPAPKGKAKPAGKKQKETKLGMRATKDGDFSEWYSQVVIESEMISHYDVSGMHLPAVEERRVYGLDCGRMFLHLALPFPCLHRMLHSATLGLCHLGRDQELV